MSATATEPATDPAADPAEKPSERPDDRQRHPDDLIRVVVGVLGFAAMTLLAIADDEVDALERAMFQVFNALPDAAEPMLWFVMQFGSIAAVPIIALVALWRRRKRLARDIMLGGFAGWLLSYCAKELIGRARPGDLLAEIVMRGGHVGLGYPSGHATVAAAMAAVIAPHLPKRARRWLWGAVFAVGIGRLYVGAHLPLDVLGGWLLGWAVGSAVLLIFGSPVGVPDLDDIRRRMRARGLAVGDISYVTADARGSVPLVIEMEDGQTLFAKVLNSQHRSADMLFKGLRSAMYSTTEDETPFVSAKQQAEHEVLLTLLAREAGVRVTPHIQILADGTSDALVVQGAIDGVGLDDHLADHDLSDELLKDVFGQVALLLEAKIAHRDLRPANFVVDPEAQEAHVVDFGFAQTSATPRRLAWDVAELLGGLAPHVAVTRLADVAENALGEEVLQRALPLLTTSAFSSATRDALDEEEGLLDELREAVAARVGVDLDEEDDAQLLRVRPRTLAIIVVVGLGLYALFPQLSELPDAWNALLDANPWLLVGAIAASAGTYLGAGLTLVGASPASLPFTRAVTAALAGSFASRLAPGGLGRVGLDVRLMTKAGASRAEAVAGETMLSLSGAVVHITAMVFIGIRYGRDVLGNTLPDNWTLVAGAVVVLALAGILSTQTEKGRELLREAKEALRTARETARDPERVAQLLGGAIILNAFYIAALFISVTAVGGEVGAGAVALVYLGGAIFTAVSPTPGGLGAVEAAMVAGLTFVGVGSAAAVAGVLVFRLLTFWFPTLPGWFALQWLRRRDHL